MNILFATAELAPYAKTGNLGQIAAELPTALQKRGHAVSLVMPLYRSVLEKFKGLKKSQLKISVPLGGYSLPVSVWQGTVKGVSVFALQRDEYFDRSNLYGTDEEGDYIDNAVRFGFFSRAVVELAKHIEPQIDVLHANDWHTAMATVYSRAWGMPFKTVLTVHDHAYQGNFDAFAFNGLCLPPEYFSPEGVEFYNRVNFLKGGIMLSHALATPRTLDELKSEDYSCGLHGVIQANEGKLTQIPNGSAPTKTASKTKTTKKTKTPAKKPVKNSSPTWDDTAKAYEKLYSSLQF